MSNTITSKVIGQLTQNKEYPSTWESNPIAIPFFDNKKVAMILDFISEKDTTFLTEADQVLANFLGLSAVDRNAITELAYENCVECVDNGGSYALDELEEKLELMHDKNEIWDFVHPTIIYVTRRHKRDKDLYVSVGCDCDWEEEHGLLLVFRQGKKLTRLSQQDGHLTEADASDIPDEEDELLSQF